MRKTLLLFLLVLAPLLFAQAANVGLVVTAPKQISSNEVELSFLLSNPFSERAGTLSLAYNPELLEMRQANAQCNEQTPRICTLPVDVAGQQEVKVRVGLKGYFDRESIDVFYSVPAQNASNGVRMFLSNSAEPGALTVTQLTLVGFALFLLGLIFFALVLFKSGISLVKENFLLLSVLANLLAGAGAMLAFTPSLSVYSGLVFSLVFAAGFLLLSYLHKVREEAPKAITLEDIAKERSRLQDTMNVAKIRFMKREIDDKTFARLTGDIELERVKLEAKERELRAQQQPKPATPAQPPQQS